jgi:hypothetical protein
MDEAEFSKWFDKRLKEEMEMDDETSAWIAAANAKHDAEIAEILAIVGPLDEKLILTKFPDHTHGANFTVEEILAIVRAAQRRTLVRVGGLILRAQKGDVPL